jgi:hypothetical protein
MKVLKHILRLILYGMGAVLLLLLLVAGFTQTQMFRDRLRSLALNELDSVFVADVALGEIHGNLVTGFSIDGITISLRGDTVLNADHLNIRYDLLQLWGKTISVHDVTLFRPDVRLIRSIKGKWNVDEMLRATDEDTTRNPFTWPVIVRRCEIRDGRVSIADSVGMKDPENDRLPDAIRYSTLHIRDVNTVIAFEMQHREYHATISRFACAVPGSPISVRQLTGDFKLSPASARVRDLRIVTDSSRIAISAEMLGVDLFGGTEYRLWANAPTRVDLRIDRLNFHEMGCLIPPTDILVGTVDGSLHAEGPYGALHIEPLDLRYNSSRIQATGEVRNLHDPGNLTLDVAFGQTEIDPADPLALLPSFELPDFRPVGPVALRGAYKGTPRDFAVRLEAECQAGKISTDLFTLRIGGPQKLQYRGEVVLSHLDLAKLLGKHDLESNLNGHVVVDGYGVKPVRMNAVASASLDTSTFRRLPIRRAQMQITAREQRMLGSISLAVGDAAVDLEGHLDSLGSPRPAFSVNGTVQALNLASFLDDSTYDSDLNCSLDARGAGVSLGTFGGNITMEFDSSRYRDYPLTGGQVKFLVSQDDTTHKQLHLTSPFVEASVDGEFDLDYLRSLVKFEVQNALLSVHDRLAPFDTTFASKEDTTLFHALRQRLANARTSLRCQYSASVKDIRLLSLIFNTRAFNGSGVIAGTLEGDYFHLSSSTRLNVVEFYYGDANSGMLIEDGECWIETNELTPDRSFATADLHVRANVRAMNINMTELDSVGVDLRINDRNAVYSSQGALNHIARWDIKGEARLQGDSILCVFGPATATYGGYRWTGDSGMTLSIMGTAIRLSRAMFRRGDEDISGWGAIRKGGGISASVQARGVRLDDLRFFLSEEETLQNEKSFGGAIAATVTAGGTLDHPEFNATVRADSIAIREIPFGDLDGTATYGDGVLSLNVVAGEQARLTSGSPALTLTGTLPVAIGREKISSEQEINLTVHADRAQINVLDPLLPNFNQLTGTMDCDLRITGPVRNPLYAGSLELRDCGFLFEANYMYYLLDGKFAAEGDRIRVVDATIRNIPSDEKATRTGRVKVTGDFALRGVTPGDFNLSATGQLNVVKESTRRSSLFMYGDLFAEIGSKGLHFSGEVDNSLLRGDLIIRNSSLVFPPTKQAASEDLAFSVPVVIVDDTSHVDQRQSISAAYKYFGGAHSSGGGLNADANLQGTKSFLDGLRYDLDIEATGGSTDIRMIFDPISSEELVATIDGRLSITEDGRRWLGDLDVSRAYYNFYRRFDASGEIRFTGDFMNPELDILATYRGTRTIQDTISSDKNEIILVTVKITGPRREPKLNMSMTIDNADYNAYTGLKSNDVQSDAIGFIIYGTFPLTSAQKGEMTSEMDKTLRRSLLTGASSLLTGTLSEFLRAQTGFINSVEFNFNSVTKESESADIRLSGSVGEGYWRFGGKILDDPFGTANFSLQYSFGSIFNAPQLRNLMMELESKVERGAFGQATDLRRTNSARVFYRFSF